MVGEERPTTTGYGNAASGRYFPDPEKFRTPDGYVPSWDWDPVKQFTGFSRLADRYHCIEPYYKFDPTPPEDVLWSKHWWQGIMAGFVMGGKTVENIVRKKPWYAQIYMTLGYGAIMWYGIGYYYMWSRSIGTKGEAVIKHYIELHPEDFPIIERKKYKNILADWYPVRT